MADAAAEKVTGYFVPCLSADGGEWGQKGPHATANLNQRVPKNSMFWHIRHDSYFFNNLPFLFEKATKKTCPRDEPNIGFDKLSIPNIESVYG